MKELLNKDIFTIEELEKIEDYFSDFDHVEELIELDCERINKIIDLLYEQLGYTLIPNALEYYTMNVAIDAKCMFEESELDKYIHCFELTKRCSLNELGIGYILGDYYLSNNDKEKALYYYESTFKAGFDLYLYGYMDSLQRYIDLLSNEKKIEVLKSLINNTPIEGSYELDYVDIHLLLINMLDKKTDEYLYYLDEAYKIVLPLVRTYQEKNKNRDFFSDSDVERDLCEVLALKLEYFVGKKDYINAMNIYNELTREIGRSDCTRYYHARDKYYLDMLNDMRKEYPEVEFLLDIGYKTFEVEEEISDINNFLKKKITLKDETGRTLKVKVDYIYEKSVNLKPIIPLIKEGGTIFTEIIKKGDKIYLKNKLSH